MTTQSTNRITRYRSSKSGKFIKKTTATKMNPSTWEKERIKINNKKK